MSFIRRKMIPQPNRIFWREPSDWRTKIKHVETLHRLTFESENGSLTTTMLLLRLQYLWTCLGQFRPFSACGSGKSLPTNETHVLQSPEVCLSNRNNPDDKQKRLRAFFSCLRSDDSPPLVQQGNVPQHLLLMACVLRYIMTVGHHLVFKKPELDAFLVTAFSPQLRNAHYLASLQGGIITPRGIHIASLFMAVSPVWFLSC